MGLGKLFRKTRDALFGSSDNSPTQEDILRAQRNERIYKKSESEFERINSTVDILNSQKDIRTSILSSARQATFPRPDERKLNKSAKNRQLLYAASGGK